LRSTAGQQQVSRVREKVKTPTASSQTSRKETIFCGFVLAPATSHRQVRQGLRQGYIWLRVGVKGKESAVCATSSIDIQKLPLLRALEGVP